MENNCSWTKMEKAKKRPYSALRGITENAPCFTARSACNSNQNLTYEKTIRL